MSLSIIISKVNKLLIWTWLDFLKKETMSIESRNKFGQLKDFFLLEKAGFLFNNFTFMQ